MFRIGVFCFLFLVQVNTYPTCQNWCMGQQRQVPNQRIGNNWGTVCNQAPRPTPSPCGARQPNLNPWGLPNPSYPGYPSGTFWPGGTLPGQTQQQQSWPWPWQVVGNQPGYPAKPVTQEPVKVVVQDPYYPAQKVVEWVCPTDPEPRARSIGKEDEPELRECIYDENCPSAPIRQKCCYDSGIGGKVCKPAIPI